MIVKGRTHTMSNRENRSYHSAHTLSSVVEYDLLILLRFCKGDICSSTTILLKLIQSQHLILTSFPYKIKKKLAFDETYEFQMMLTAKERACLDSKIEYKDLIEKTLFLESIHTTLSFSSLFMDLS